MASKSAGGLPPKPSFAKIAAMAATPQPRPTITPQPSQPPRDSSRAPVPDLQPALITSPSQAPPAAANPEQPADVDIDVVTGRIEGLALLNKKQYRDRKDIDVGIAGLASARSGETNADDQSEVSGSSNKPTSFDTKSMASVTTFAMEEKESLRPDDSASLQGPDEDETGSIPASGATSSRVGSDVGKSFAKEPPRNPVVLFGPSGRRVPLSISANPPRFGDMTPNVTSGYFPAVPVDASERSDLIAPPMREFAATIPDEKLVEAMSSPKDRLLLLQLEEKLVYFIQESKQESLDLPPQHSFGRLLAHKLADYYSLPHHVTEDSSSVRVFRPPNPTLPQPLGSIANSLTTNPTPPTGASAVKILRRSLAAGRTGANGSTPASSSAPSKATSEAGAETNSDEGLISPAETTPPKDKSKWTREEKEAHYNAARERIFRGCEQPNASENNSTGEISADMSRSSSSSGKKKTHKQKTPKDDSFEARSSYVAGPYPGMAMPTSQSQFAPPNGGPAYPQQQFAHASGPPHTPGVQFGNPAHQQYHGYDATYNAMNAYPPGGNQYSGQQEAWGNVPSPQPGGYYNFNVPGQAPPQGFSQTSSGMSSPAMSQYQQPAPQFAPQQHHWQQGQYQNAYQPSQIGQNLPPAHWPGYAGQAPSGPPASYQFGQLPFQGYAASPPPVNQHPIPGSFNRSIFNPQTRSFVPSGPNARYGGKPNQARPKPNANHQGPERSGPSSHTSSRSGYSSSDAVAAQIGGNYGTSSDSIQKKWGTPSFLPPKPPPSQVAPAFNVEATPTLSLAGIPAKGNPMMVPGGSSPFPKANGSVAAKI